MPRDVSLWYSKFLTWQNWILIKLWYICPCSVITIFVSSINLFYSIILKKLLEMHSKTQFSAGRQFPLLPTILNSLFLKFFFSSIIKQFFSSSIKQILSFIKQSVSNFIKLFFSSFFIYFKFTLYSTKQFVSRSTICFMIHGATAAKYATVDIFFTNCNHRGCGHWIHEYNRCILFHNCVHVKYSFWKIIVFKYVFNTKNSWYVFFFLIYLDMLFIRKTWNFAIIFERIPNITFWK